jgi:hypothetical protein
MADIDTILGLVAEGALTPEEADEILAAMSTPAADERPADAEPTSRPTPGSPRHLRVEVTDHGRSVVNLRVPVNIAGWASSFLPGLSDQDAERIRGAIDSGSRGTILDIGDEDGRVLIVSE